MKLRFDKIRYIINHRKAFRGTERRLKGKVSTRGYLHDLDKIFTTLLFGARKSSKWHRRYSRHHDRCKTKKDFTEMVIDWECARLTKIDKPLNAQQTMEKYYPELKEDIIPILKELNLYKEKIRRVLI